MAGWFPQVTKTRVLQNALHDLGGPRFACWRKCCPKRSQRIWITRRKPIWTRTCPSWPHPCWPWSKAGVPPRVSPPIPIGKSLRSIMFRMSWSIRHVYISWIYETCFVSYIYIYTGFVYTVIRCCRLCLSHEGSPWLFNIFQIGPATSETIQLQPWQLMQVSALRSYSIPSISCAWLMKGLRFVRCASVCVYRLFAFLLFLCVCSLFCLLVCLFVGWFVCLWPCPVIIMIIVCFSWSWNVVNIVNCINVPTRWCSTVDIMMHGISHSNLLIHLIHDSRSRLSVVLFFKHMLL